MSTMRGLNRARIVVTAGVVCLLASPARAAQLRLPAVLGDHMVLQRDSKVDLWGWANPGDVVQVTASWLSAALETHTAADGRWLLSLRTPQAGGPHRLVFQANERIELEDVYSGEVWICSGQSNMDWHVAQSENPEATIAEATDSLLRLFDVRDGISTSPADDVVGHWVPCSPETISTFSAVATHFGRNLRASLDGVPIGLISTNWSGTPIESWVSAGGLGAFPEFRSILERVKQAPTTEQMAAEVADQQREWWGRLEASGQGFRDRWALDLGTEGWVSANAPLAFDSLGWGNFDGVAWLRREVTIDEQPKGDVCYLELGPIDDMDLVYWDGEVVGSTTGHGSWRDPRRYALPAEAANPGKHLLCVVVVDTGGAGTLGMLEREPYAMRLVGSDGALIAELDGTWQARRGTSMADLGSFPMRGWFRAVTPSALFNGMIAPLVPYRVRGAIWYQGESNVGRSLQYQSLFPAMIRDWRKHWGQSEFPFYYVQLAPFAYAGDTGKAAELREAQGMALAEPDTGMVVTMDIGNPLNIHPMGKNVVGGRLAALALKHTYDVPGLLAESPRFAAATMHAGTVSLSFDFAAGGLTTSDGKNPSHFQLAGDDRVFHPADAEIDGERVLVRSSHVPNPIAVRFAWGAADEPNLIGRASNLPVGCFRSESWSR